MQINITKTITVLDGRKPCEGMITLVQQQDRRRLDRIYRQVSSLYFVLKTIIHAFSSNDFSFPTLPSPLLVSLFESPRFLETPIGSTQVDSNHQKLSSFATNSFQITMAQLDQLLPAAIPVSHRPWRRPGRPIENLSVPTFDSAEILALNRRNPPVSKRYDGRWINQKGKAPKNNNNITDSSRSVIDGSYVSRTACTGPPIYPTVRKRADQIQ